MTLITVRKGNSGQWLESNRILQTGEPGYDLSNSILKIGDGTSSWTELPHYGSGLFASINHVHNTSDIINFNLSISGYLQPGSGILFNFVNDKLVINAVSTGQDSSLRELFLPPAPTLLYSNIQSNEVSLGWIAPSATWIPPVNDYAIQYSSGQSSSWANYADYVSPLTNVIISGLNYNIEYQFRVAAINGVGQGTWSSGLPITLTEPI